MATPEELERRLNELGSKLESMTERLKEKDETLERATNLIQTLADGKGEGGGNVTEDVDLKSLDFADTTPEELIGVLEKRISSKIEGEIKSLKEVVDGVSSNTERTQRRLTTKEFFDKFPRARERLDELKEIEKEMPGVGNPETLYKALVGKEQFEREASGEDVLDSASRSGASSVFEVDEDATLEEVASKAFDFHSGGETFSESSSPDPFASAKKKMNGDK